MALRRAPRDSARQNSSSPAEKRPRRVLAAFAVGAAIATAGLAIFATDLASAHGPFSMSNPTSPTGGLTRFFLGPSPTEAAEEDVPRRHRHARKIDVSAHASHSGAGQAVCVRLCDGFFFPLSVAGGNAEAACDSQCPDAPTEVYYRSGSDRIEDSVSAHGKLYSALPVSLRYRATSDSTCACHRGVIAYAPLRDSTLKRGDALMTPAGMVVFHGAEGATHAPKDFTALSASGLPAAQRSALADLERVSVTDVRPSLSHWLAAQTQVPTPVAAHAERVARSDDRIRLLAWRGEQD